LNGQGSVLIVDRSEETREVLQTALERRGVRTMAASRTAAGLVLARRHHPDLIVLDLELDDTSAEQFSSGAGVPPAFAPNANLQPADALPGPQYRPRMVLLGNLRRWRDRLPEGEFVPKPYHYGPLIRKIEELLAMGTHSGELGTCRRCSSSVEPTKVAVSN
jgi:hypothetical protein